MYLIEGDLLIHSCLTPIPYSYLFSLSLQASLVIKCPGIHLNLVIMKL